jgi:hypothetical protein
VALRRYLGQVSEHLDDSFSTSEPCVLSAENRRSLKSDAVISARTWTEARLA